MTIPEIGQLEPIAPHTLWPDEARDFTPWLAQNLDRLAAELHMDLELVQREATLTGAGRVDILAKQVRSGAAVVIENQLYTSDDDHCVRLLGYAATAEADIVVWVARRFTQYHRSIVRWLNNGDTINVYAVELEAWRLDQAIAASFRLVEGPQPRPADAQSAEGGLNTNQRYGYFYGPLTDRLRRNGMRPVGRGGWRGRWRSFQTVHPHLMYSLGLEPGGEARVYLEARGEEGRPVFHAIQNHRDQIDAEFPDAAIEWHEGERETWVAVKIGASLDDPEDKQEETRTWMFDTVIKLRNVIQPRVEHLMNESRSDESDGSEVEPVAGHPDSETETATP